jgi:hypothetical protein
MSAPAFVATFVGAYLACLGIGLGIAWLMQRQTNRRIARADALAELEAAAAAAEKRTRVYREQCTLHQAGRGPERAS